MWGRLGGAVAIAGAIQLVGVARRMPDLWRRSKKVETVLARNLRRLYLCTRRPHPHRIALLGQPGAGKSSILKKLSQGRARPEPVVGVHTDATNWAETIDVELLTKWDDYIAVDSPGYGTTTHPVSTYIDLFRFRHFSVILLFIRGKVRDVDVRLYQHMQSLGVRIIVIRSFAESVDAADRVAVCDDLCKYFVGLKRGSVVFASSRTGEGLDKLRAMI